MALNIKNAEVERLASELAQLCGETKTQTIRRALAERRDRLMARGGGQGASGSLQDYLEKSVWPRVPEVELGRELTRSEEDSILGFEPEGY